MFSSFTPDWSINHLALSFLSSVASLGQPKIVASIVSSSSSYLFEFSCAIGRLFVFALFLSCNRFLQSVLSGWRFLSRVVVNVPQCCRPLSPHWGFLVCGFFVKGHLNPPCQIGVAVFILSELFCRQMRRWFVTLWESCLSCVWTCSDCIDYCCLTFLLILACVRHFSPRCLSSLLEGFLPKVCLSSVLSLFLFCCGLPDLSH